MRKINIALPKGKRLLGAAYQIFKEAGYASQELEKEVELRARKQLEFSSDNGEANFILVRIADIPQYVDKNWADIGISAFDCYREYELSNSTLRHSLRGDNFISNILPDLKLCEKSRFCVAGRPESREFYNLCKKSDEKILSVATQHPNIALKYFNRQGMIVDIIYISGSSEVMPKYGEVDVIFDIVESGRALEENGLEIFDEAMPIKTKVLVSKAALKYDANIENMIGRLRNAIK
ncbi:MAG: ATP phosphoribosyltransferase [Clostridiales bacterium]|jgi:ATP phosphoribosyltransferase|nr:ATP phosphoribosyltransferase [Clostridiales bacterium]